MVDEYSTSEISEKLISEIKEAIGSKEYGSVEIYIESGRVVQITERVIRKKIRSNGNETKKGEMVYWRPIKNRK
ncbi:DUF2292 domain-containing protein [Patescibacteria group bacterium]|nr:DUF2292 domain-containing protein [Patescibacteria group bacterium]